MKSHVLPFFLQRFEKSVPPQQNAFDKSYFVFVFLYLSKNIQTIELIEKNLNKINQILGFSLWAQL